MKKDKYFYLVSFSTERNGLLGELGQGSFTTDSKELSYSQLKDHIAFLKKKNDREKIIIHSTIRLLNK